MLQQQDHKEERTREQDTTRRKTGGVREPTKGGSSQKGRIELK